MKTLTKSEQAKLWMFWNLIKDKKNTLQPTAIGKAMRDIHKFSTNA
jgi:hypothetical protein